MRSVVRLVTLGVNFDALNFQVGGDRTPTTNAQTTQSSGSQRLRNSFRERANGRAHRMKRPSQLTDRTDKFRCSAVVRQSELKWKRFKYKNKDFNLPKNLEGTNNHQEAYNPHYTLPC